MINNETIFRVMSTCMQDAMVMMNSEGSITFWNNAAVKLFGWSESEALGKELHYLITPAGYRQAYEKAMVEFRKSGKGAAIGKTLELQALCKEGKEFPVELSLTATKVSGAWNSVGIIRDISDRKQAEKLLKTSNERLELTIRGSNNGLWDWPDIKIDKQWWSSRFFKLIGYGPDELPASYSIFGRLLHPEDRDKTLQAEEAHLKEHKPYDVECRMLSGSGEYRWFRSRGQAIWDEQGGPLRMSGSIVDITRQKQITAQLHEARDELYDILDFSKIETTGERQAAFVASK